MFKQLLKEYMGKAGFGSNHDLAEQISQYQCKDSNQHPVTVEHSTISRWLRGEKVGQRKHTRAILLCLCKVLNIRSIQKINQFLKAAEHRPLSETEQQAQFSGLPLDKTDDPADLPVPQTSSESKPAVAKDDAQKPIPIPSSVPTDKEQVVITTVELSQIEQLAQNIIEHTRHHKAAIAVAIPILAASIGGLIYQRQPDHSTNMVITISHPQEGQRCPHNVPIGGTVTNLPADKELWVVKEPHKGSYHPDAGPAIVQGDQWRGTAFIGRAVAGADTGVEFPIHIVLTSHETGKKFQNYLDNAHKTGAWIGETTLYDGKIIATVKVIRDDSAECTFNVN